MNKAYFAKYIKNTSMDSAINLIQHLNEESAIPIEYDIIAEVKCDRKQIEHVFENGSIATMPSIAMLGTQSIQNSKGVWHCIVLSGPKESLVIYTCGTSDLLYYSFIA